MTGGTVIVVVAAVVVALFLGWLGYLLADRRDHRRFVTGLSVLGGPDGVRAGGEAFRSVGDPPALQVRGPGARFGLGGRDDRRPRGEVSSAPPSRRPRRGTVVANVPAHGPRGRRRRVVRQWR